MKNRLPTTFARRHQRGVALFVALIAMVILSLAGLALVRSVDTTSSIASNIAFRQGSIGPTNEAIESAEGNLFKAAVPIVQTADDLLHVYYSSLQPGEKPNGVPAVLFGDYLTMSTNYAAAGLPAAVVDPKTAMEVRSVIERICSATGAVSIGTCDTLPPKVSKAGTDNKPLPKAIPLPPIPNFRVTVRVDLPNANTASIAQAILR